MPTLEGKRRGAPLERRGFEQKKKSDLVVYIQVPLKARRGMWKERKREKKAVARRRVGMKFSRCKDEE